MGGLGSIAFATPWLLWALAALPVLWWLLRAVPPAPLRRRFPAVTLLLGLKDDESETDRTPWWLLLLRCLAVAALILGLAGPVLNPRAAVDGRGPLLVLMDASWASAQDWAARLARLEALLDEAGRAGRPVALAALSDLPAGGPAFQSAEAWRSRLAGIVPAPWEPAPEDALGWLEAGQDVRHETVWFSDGLERPGRAALHAALAARGPLTVIESGVPRLALLPPVAEAGRLLLRAQRAPGGGAQEFALVARGPDPNGVERELARAALVFGAGESAAEAALDLPLELRNRIQRFEIVGQRSAGAVSLADDALRRRKVALLAGHDAGEAGELLSPLHYLRQALAPAAELVEGPFGDLMLAAPDVLILADVAQLAPDEARRVEDWVRSGGLLLRFAGPRLAASELSRVAEDVLMPVRLRAGGRDVGGAMSWGAPRRLAPFAAGSVFAGLDIPEEVTITSQVLAQPDPALADRVEAALADGTPLVTAKTLGEGRLVLFHVTANADWSNLPLSGLFVRMLERLAVAARAAGAGEEALAGVTWTPESVLDGFGAAMEPGNLPGVPGARLAAGRPAPDLRPGIYAAGPRLVAVNVAGSETVLAAPDWPAGTALEGLALAERRDLAGPLLVLALGLLLADALATLALGGRLRGARVAVVAAGLVLAAGAAPQAVRADDARAIAATRETVLAYVRTGDPALDRISEAGLRGLSRVLRLRTSVEPAEPMGVDIETDELAFFPFLYWPVTETQRPPGEAAYERLNRYLRGGGMILFDTRDADIGRFGGGTPLGRAFRRLAAPLAIPPLEPVPPDHVLTRTFYLLQDFPGRHNAPDVWVEAAPPGAVQAEGMPFRTLNDGVTPVVIGGNDWAAAWAIDANGQPLLPVGRGFGGERQREMAFRFGVNLVMHVLTGNYKSDQVHVPALLERLGQ
ncbi:MAG: LytTR family transcriptional regulator [Alphaproteobacteria bacterium HGW-Alphaproteobacteria-2]|nr:MAG: LytTR family transcriptional regulator [Alphaproteobacteria bacterium HGW-Alphaproteobacteria-2]